MARLVAFLPFQSTNKRCTYIRIEKIHAIWFLLLIVVGSSFIVQGSFVRVASVNNRQKLPLVKNACGPNRISWMFAAISNEQSNGGDDDDDGAFPFDGQLFYGLEQKPGETEIRTSLAEMRSISARLNREEKSDEGIRLQEDSMIDDREFEWNGNRIPIKSRTVPLGRYIEGAQDVELWELANTETQELVESWMSKDEWNELENENVADSSGDFDPFGVVMWPGSIIAAQEMYRLKNNFVGKKVLTLGSGTGLEAQIAARLGAAHVLATDNYPLTLALLEYATKRAGLSHVIDTTLFDICSQDPLPDCDIVIAADVLYNDVLAKEVGRRCVEALSKVPQPRLIVTDSQRFHGTDFLDSINCERSDQYKLHWEEKNLEQVEVSGILINDDQKINVKARLLSIA